MDIKNLEPLLVSADGAARLLGISRRHFLQMRATGRLGPAAVDLGQPGKRRLPRWSVAELASWIHAGCPSADVWRQETANLVEGGK